MYVCIYIYIYVYVRERERERKRERHHRHAVDVPNSSGQNVLANTMVIWQFSARDTTLHSVHIA